MAKELELTFGTKTTWDFELLLGDVDIDDQIRMQLAAGNLPNVKTVISKMSPYNALTVTVEDPDKMATTMHNVFMTVRVIGAKL